MSKGKRSKKQFFIVFSPDGLAPPRVVHPTHKGALYAAAQMAKLHPENEFYVMGSMSARVKPRADQSPPPTTTEETTNGDASRSLIHGE